MHGLRQRGESSSLCQGAQQWAGLGAGLTMQSDRNDAAADRRSVCMVMAGSASWVVALRRAACVRAEHQKRRGCHCTAAAGVERFAAGA